MNYRNEARRALQRANDHLDDPGISRGRYAALELRMALESLVYERADSYREELPGRALYTWQPGKLLKMLLEIDPLADKILLIAPLIFLVFLAIVASFFAVPSFLIEASY